MTNGGAVGTEAHIGNTPARQHTSQPAPRPRGPLLLLPRERLAKTGPVDHADWNTQPLLGWISRQRFRMIVSLLPRIGMQRILEVGYGSGIFMPELYRYTEELCGIDIHSYPELVREALVEFGVEAQLSSGSAEAMPFPDGHFDAIVCVSSLEFIDDLDGAMREFQRTLRVGGALVVVTPSYSPLADFGLRLLTGKSAAEDFGERRQRIIPTLRRHFREDQTRTWPWQLGLYRALRLYAL